MENSKLAAVPIFRPTRNILEKHSNSVIFLLNKILREISAEEYITLIERLA